MTKPSDLPLSLARLSRDLVFVSGQLALEDGKIAGDDIATQTNLVIDSIERQLAAFGLLLEDVIKTTVWIDQDPSDALKMREAFRFMSTRSEDQVRDGNWAGELFAAARSGRLTLQEAMGRDQRLHHTESRHDHPRQRSLALQSRKASQSMGSCPESTCANRLCGSRRGQTRFRDTLDFAGRRRRLCGRKCDRSQGCAGHAPLRLRQSRRTALRRSRPVRRDQGRARSFRLGQLGSTCVRVCISRVLKWKCF